MGITLGLNVLTPVWTGDVARVARRIRETGIIGSLRWWYEAVVRSLDIYACDPTDPVTRCPGPGSVLCNVCDLFGATGKARKFKLTIRGGAPVYQQANADEFIQWRPASRQKGWYLGAGLVNLPGKPIKLNFDFLHAPPTQYDSIKDTLVAILGLTSNWAAIGAKTQLGYGVFQLKDEAGNDLNIANDKMICSLMESASRPLRQGVNRSDLPNLRDFFFAKIPVSDRISPSWMHSVDGISFVLANPRYSTRLSQWQKSHPVSFPVSPAIKSMLRFGGSLTRDEADFLFGFVQQRRCPYCFNRIATRSQVINCSGCGARFPEEEAIDKQAARVNVSFAYRLDGAWEVRVWGYIPTKIPLVLNKNRDQIVGWLHQQLLNPAFWQVPLGKGKVDLSKLQWREFDAPSRCLPACSAPGCVGGTLREKVTSFIRCLAR